jgi:hypothetical protein
MRGLQVKQPADEARNIGIDGYSVWIARSRGDHSSRIPADAWQGQ